MAQTARDIDEWQTPAVQSAVRMSLEAWSSVAEKLDALTYIVQHPSTECVDVLHQAIFLLGLSRPLHSVDRLVGIPKGGEVAGAAARGLAACAEFGGLRVLEELLLQEGNTRAIRETAAFGLGGTSRLDVFPMYSKALQTWDADVRFRVLLSLRESLDRIVEVDHDVVQETLIGLCDVFISRIRELQGGEHDVIVSILSRFIGPKIEERLTLVLMSARDTAVNRGAFEVLRRRNNKNARARLMRVFVLSTRPSQLYGLIADELRPYAATEVEIKQVAQSVIDGYPFSRWLIYCVSGRERTRRAMQVKAARRIIS